MNPLRFVCMFAAAAVLAGGVFAQTTPMPPPMPANVAPPPLPAAGEPSPQAGVSPSPLEEYRGGTDEEPQVTIIRRDTETVEEVRVGGVLRYVRVTPRIGRPYYLVPTSNGQNFTRQDSLGSGLSVPMWLLFSW
jgi:Protein of unknown function (DUF2782)